MHIFTGSLTPRFSLALIAPPLSVRSCWSSSPGLHGSWFSWASFFSSGRFFQVHSLKLAFKTQVIPSWVFRRTTVSSVLGANTFKLKLFYSSDNSQVKQTSLVQEVKRFLKENYQYTLRTLHGRAEIWRYEISPLVLKIFHSFAPSFFPPRCFFRQVFSGLRSDSILCELSLSSVLVYLPDIWM